jgi:AcrR family transcriptional regulator
VGSGGNGAVREVTPAVRARIVRAARLLLEERGGEEALTLRAVARGAGVSAPSVYHHFPSLRAVLEAVIDEAYGEYAAATYGAAAGVEDPLERLRIGGLGCLRFAREQPATYRLLFSRHRPSELSGVGARAAADHEITVDAVAACGPAGRPAAADARTDAMLLWLGLHGAADLRPSHPRYPWPPEDEIVEQLLRRIVLHDASRAG